MDSTKKGFENIDEYIATFPTDIQKILQGLREVIQEAAPQAVEKISYQMPTFYLNGNLIHFAGYKNHIGIYPAPRAIDVFKKELSNYEGSKGTIKFPIDEPLPMDLIRRIVLFRVSENLKKAEEKATKKKK
jgi:uncharacterized protein YdhG (YjbR/CyaY superfamily)